jgi:hypothetical protein
MGRVRRSRRKRKEKGRVRRSGRRGEERGSMSEWKRKKWKDYKGAGGEGE